MKFSSSTSASRSAERGGSGDVEAGMPPSPTSAGLGVAVDPTGVSMPSDPCSDPQSHRKPPASTLAKAPRDGDTSPVPFPALHPSASTTSAVEAAAILANWSAHPQHPRNWSRRRKWQVTATVAFTGFIATLGSSIGVPGLHAAMDEFGEGNTKIGVLITTFYVLGMGAGPFLFSPLSELYGRQVAYLSSQTCFLVFCIGTAVVHDMWGLIILRFFCGVFASSGPALGMATCADVWAPEERGKPVSLYAVGPMAGPVLGGMLGYWILPGGWRWLFWTVTILAAFNTSLFILAATETNAEVIEKKLRYRMTHAPVDTKLASASISVHRVKDTVAWMSVMVSRQETVVVFKRTFSRPFRLLFRNPVCALFSLYYAYIYALIYIFLVSIPLLFGAPPFSRAGLFSYDWPLSTLPLAYLGLTIGFACAATAASSLQDKIYARLKAVNGGRGEPEYRLVMTQIGMIIMPIGLFIFGWTAEARTHWIGPQIGAAVVALGLMLAFNSIQNFLVDAFFPYSAAAVAAATACRSVMTSVLPVLAGDMFETLGWGKGGTLLACIALAAVPAPALLFKHGRALRERYAFTG